MDAWCRRHALVCLRAVTTGPVCPCAHLAPPVTLSLSLSLSLSRYPSIHDHGDNDNSLWMMANPDWATLALWRGFEPAQALAVARKTLDWWRVELKDMWNVVAVGGGINTTAAGQPLANSHYGYVESHRTSARRVEPVCNAPFALAAVRERCVGGEGGERAGVASPAVCAVWGPPTSP